MQRLNMWTLHMVSFYITRKHSDLYDYIKPMAHNSLLVPQPVGCHIWGAEYALFGGFAHVNAPNFWGAFHVGIRSIQYQT